MIAQKFMFWKFKIQFLRKSVKSQAAQTDEILIPTPEPEAYSSEEIEEQAFLEESDEDDENVSDEDEEEESSEHTNLKMRPLTEPH